MARSYSSNTTSCSRGAKRPSFAVNVLPSENQRAWGMPGARRTRSLACKVKKAHEHSHHRSTGFTRHSRTQWF
jgi:hypothetical protein